MATYDPAGDEVRSLVKTLINKHFPELKEAGVTIDLLMARSKRNETTGEPTGPAIKHNGYPCAALAKITSYEHRVKGEKDCSITFDDDMETGWGSWTQARREATIRHELMHFTIVRTKPKYRKKKGVSICVDEGGAIVLDYCNRPKLKMRLHDTQLGVFHSIIEEYGEESFDGEMAAGFARKLQQMEFAFEAAEATA